MRELFYGICDFNQNITAWDVSRVTDMSKMFMLAHDFNQDISTWDVSHVTLMNDMFHHVHGFEQDLSPWDVSSVTDMSNMFNMVHEFNCDLSKWDVSRVTNMYSMFAEAFEFNGDISTWHVSRVTNMAQMFKSAWDFNQNIAAWDVSNVVDMSAMFENAEFFNQDISAWHVSRVTNMKNMFLAASSFNRSLCGTSWIKMAMYDSGLYKECTTTSIPILRVPTDPVIEYLNEIIVGGVVFFLLVVALIAAAVIIRTRSGVKESRAHGPLPDSLVTNNAPIPQISMPLIVTSRFTSLASGLTTLPQNQRTLANSNYKHFYAEAKAAEFQHDLLGAVHHVLKLFAKRLNPTHELDALMTEVSEFMTSIQQDAFRHNDDLKDDVGAVAEYLWTSGKKHAAFHQMELCSVLNTVIRDDIAVEVEAAASIFRSINARRVNRETNGPSLDAQSFPPDGETWRGGGFRRNFQSFFTKGKKYRVPGFLATSNLRSVAAAFVYKADDAHPTVMWRIVFDPRGKLQPQYRVRHMTFVSKTLIPGEGEYLFAPYSVFTVVSSKWSRKLRDPHELTISAAYDNKREDESLPLAPWY